MTLIVNITAPWCLCYVYEDMMRNQWVEYWEYNKPDYWREVTLHLLIGQKQDIPLISASQKQHGLINYIDTKAKCLPSKKNWPVKGLSGRFLSEFIDWRYSQSWYFRLSFVNCSTPLLSGSTPPPPLPCAKKYTVYTRIQRVWGGDMGFWASDR